MRGNRSIQRARRGGGHDLPAGSSTWPADLVAEARTIIADVAHHSDQLIRSPATCWFSTGETLPNVHDAQRLLVVVDARRPVRRAQREDQGRAAR